MISERRKELMRITNQFKSKTINSNLLGVGLVSVLKSVGIELTPEEVALFFAGINIILRQFTTLPIELK